MRELLIIHIASLTAGILLDRVIGDPHALPHPVRAMGHLISFLEKRLLKYGTGDAPSPRDPGSERRRGTLLWLTVVLPTAVISVGIMAGAYLLHPWALGVTETILTCYILAAGSLRRESMRVVKVLEKDGVEEARRALSMIVGRDTKELTEAEILTAAVETVAENTSDGVTAPLFYTAIGGPVLGLVYKAVNTMDSMIGYRNERYEHFGRTAARMDDVWGYLPARFSALLMILGTFLAGLFSNSYSGKGAFRIWKRDRRKHLSPNSAQTESVCAGALGIQMGGTHLYGGIPVEKPTIGDRTREPQRSDVARANILMEITELLLAAVILGIALPFMMI